jgi:hypothetical protein
MMISQAYDRLLARSVSQIDWNDGSGPLRCTGGPMIVRDVETDENADAWVEASPEGFCLHFNAQDRDGQWHGQSEPLSNIASIL